jgi:hypothetical protein
MPLPWLVAQSRATESTVYAWSFEGQAALALTARVNCLVSSRNRKLDHMEGNGTSQLSAIARQTNPLRSTQDTAAKWTR